MNKQLKVYDDAISRNKMKKAAQDTSMGLQNNTFVGVSYIDSNSLRSPGESLLSNDPRRSNDGGQSRNTRGYDTGIIGGAKNKNKKDEPVPNDKGYCGNCSIACNIF